VPVLINLYEVFPVPNVHADWPPNWTVSASLLGRAKDHVFQSVANDFIVIPQEVDGPLLLGDDN
jgi:hypothetical protein